MTPSLQAARCGRLRRCRMGRRELFVVVALSMVPQGVAEQLARSRMVGVAASAAPAAGALSHVEVSSGAMASSAANSIAGAGAGMFGSVQGAMLSIFRPVAAALTAWGSAAQDEVSSQEPSSPPTALPGRKVVYEAMGEACLDAVHAMQVDGSTAGIHDLTLASRLSEIVTHTCEEQAKRRVAAVLNAPSSDVFAASTRAWCGQLRGRFELAWETGFFFSFNHTDAYRLAGLPNPFALATEQSFCSSFADALLRGNAPTVTAASAPAAVAGAVASAPASGASMRPPHSGAAGAVVATAARSQPPPGPRRLTTTAVVVAAEPPAASSAMASPTHVASASGGELPRMPRAISFRAEWQVLCDLIVGYLSSKDDVVDAPSMLRGSAPAAAAAGASVTAAGASTALNTKEALTLTAQGQDELARCVEELEALAKNVPEVTPVSAPSTAKEWANGICGDMARSFLTARRSKPGLAPQQFCPMYSERLQAMQGAIGSSEVPPSSVIAKPSAKDEVLRLRRRGAKKSLGKASARAAALKAAAAVGGGATPRTTLSSSPQANGDPAAALAAAQAASASPAGPIAAGRATPSEASWSAAVTAPWVPRVAPPEPPRSLATALHATVVPPSTSAALAATIANAAAAAAGVASLVGAAQDAAIVDGGTWSDADERAA
eukprot:CAMPEP_0170213886 /NCGR_PEP_ID=MMETSP0116_2-20130129/6569_1 /TAXON_ID=400756 /ORGANISM="Durinskia baltica, Strain CSIRO CS-38" /LENGTH=664 /DNA_ID=CAMNT_0010464441 /DNA_START=42 /DNA_END=2034 /DNA_ORIENTATION=-